MEHFGFWAWSVVLGFIPGFITGRSYGFASRPTKGDVLAGCISYAMGPWVGTIAIIFLYHVPQIWGWMLTVLVSVSALALTNWIVSVFKSDSNAKEDREHAAFPGRPRY